jgi:hypothetical protein
LGENTPNPLILFMAIFNKLASAIYNDIISGLRGYHHNPSINLD